MNEDMRKGVKRGGTLNIIEAAEAVKNGKKAKRPQWRNEFYYLQGFESVEISIVDILATDWEIEEKKIEITESEFDEAWITTELDRPEIFKRELKKRLFEK